MKQYSSDDVQCGQVLRDFLLTAGYRDVRFGNSSTDLIREHGSVSLCRDGQKTKWRLPWKY